ncbi:MAG TPA: hypothetical protein VIF82_01520 [Burkholderiaceae bacterium]|jgi:hypothetical protein
MDTDSLAREFLLKLRARVEAGGEGGMYGDRAEALRDLDNLLSFPSTGQVKVLLLPTANLQELAIECGWGEEFNELAAQLEILLDIT